MQRSEGQYDGVLAFLAPDLVKAAVEGRLPQGMGVGRLCDMPPEWSKQRKMLGLPHLNIAQCSPFRTLS